MVADSTGKYRQVTARNVHHLTRCGNCGQQHARGKCPAYGKRCNSCGKKNHFSKVCRSTSCKSSGHSSAVSASKSQSSTHDDSPGALFFAGSLHASGLTGSSDPWTVELTLGCTDQRVRFKLDTGADVTTISASTYESLRPRPALENTALQLSGPDGRQLRIRGMFTAETSHQQRSVAFPVYVIETSGDGNLLSRAVCADLQLVQQSSVDSIKKPKPACRPLVGCIDGPPVDIQLHPGSEPYHWPNGSPCAPAGSTIKSEMSSRGWRTEVS